MVTAVHTLGVAQVRQVVYAMSNGKAHALSQPVLGDPRRRTPLLND
jgi:hypothetical protein